MVHSSATLLNGVMTSIFNYKSETKDVTSIKELISLINILELLLI